MKTFSAACLGIGLALTFWGGIISVSNLLDNSPQTGIVAITVAVVVGLCLLASIASSQLAMLDKK